MGIEISGYELILPLYDKKGAVIQGKELLVNGLYGALDVVDEKTARALREGRAREIDQREKDRLLLRGHLSADPGREEEDLKILARVDRQLNRSFASIVLLPTYDCNFRCPYCFEKHRLKKGENWLHRTMTREMADAVFKACKGRMDRGVRITDLTLFGGEPLLKENMDLIRYISQKAKELSLDIRAVTNGYELDAYIDLLKEYSYTNLQITLDGDREVNDRRRIHKDGSGSYDRIIENVQLAVDNGLPVELRINVGPENINTAVSLKRVFEDKGLTDSEYFTYYFKATTGEYYPGTDREVGDCEIFEMLLQNGFSFDEAVEHESGYTMIGTGLRELLKKEHYLQASASHCGAESGMLVVDPAGVVYSCMNFVAKEDLAVGMVDIEEGAFRFGFSRAGWLVRTVQNIPECSKCPCLFACGGGCAARAFEKEGDYRKEFCGEAKEIFCSIVSHLAGESYMEGGDEELTKSLKEPLDDLSKSARETVLTSKSQKEIYETVKHFYLKKEDRKNAVQGKRDH